jgi:HD-GYP domain-containing protein (c-di-GMP phosphodiesterase class II)
MSWDRPSDAPSPAPETPAEPSRAREASTSEFGLGSLVRMRGAPLIDALDRHLPGSREHAEASASYAFATAVELGFDRSHSELVREAAKLHEVGKLYVPAYVLGKNTAGLSDAERMQLDGQYEAGYRVAHGAGIAGGVCGWILRVRERFDGRGPEELAADAIPVESRIIRVTCAADHILASPATAVASADLAERRRSAIDELRAQAGQELDPRVVEAFAAVLDRASVTAAGTPAPRP